MPNNADVEITELPVDLESINLPVGDVDELNATSITLNSPAIDYDDTSVDYDSLTVYYDDTETVTSGLDKNIGVINI